jgi:hypothetical protein
LRSKRRIKQIPEIFQTRKVAKLVIGKGQGRVNAHSSNKLSDYIDLKTSELRKRESRNRSGGNQENELHGIGWNHYEQAVVIDFIANNSE